MLNHFKECVTKKYADFNGRAGRAEFWGFVAIYLAIFFPPYLLGLILTAADIRGLGIFFSLLAWLVSLALLVPSIAVSVRRLHDRDMSGWFYLLGLVPFGGLVLLVFYCMEGTPGANRYGPDPRNPAAGYGMPGPAMGYGVPGQALPQQTYGQQPFAQTQPQQTYGQQPFGQAPYQSPQQKQF